MIETYGKDQFACESTGKTLAFIFLDEETMAFIVLYTVKGTEH